MTTSTTKKTTPKADGVLDARTFLDEHDADEVREALEPGQLGADEALINALGPRALAVRWGIDWEASGADACRQYSVAFESELRRLYRLTRR